MSEATRVFDAAGLKAIYPKRLTDLEQIRDSDFVFPPQKEDPRYLVGFAVSGKGREKAFRLRYQVFNVELGEGLAESHATQLDRDLFDDQMTHLVLVERSSGEVVGTYRLQTVRNGQAHKGIYSQQEFRLRALEPYFDRAVECGRACIAQGHRNFRAVFLLWSGIAAFLNLYAQRYLFGCCSLTSTDPNDGWRAMKTIRAKNYLHPELLVPARLEYSCGPPSREFDPNLGQALSLPKLFRAYMSLGARVMSQPALDRQFKTVDFLVILDARQVHMSSLDLVK